MKNKTMRKTPANNLKLLHLDQLKAIENAMHKLSNAKQKQKLTAFQNLVP